MEDIRKRLSRGDVIVGDGALGTMLMQRGLKSGEPPETFNLAQPHVLEEIAAEYLNAGAEIVTTNTLGASPLQLRRHSLDGKTEEINRSGVEAVRRAVGDKAYVSASVGPTSLLIKPYGKTEPEEAYSGFERQIRELLAAGADMICVETMTDLNEATLAVKAAQAVGPGVPVMATMTFENAPQGFFTIMRVSVEQAAAALEEAGATIIGSNCGYGIETMIGIAREFKKYSRLPIAIQANAGLPVIAEGRLIYPETPDFVARMALELLGLGVQIIGGCCGTGPDHIRALRKVVDAHLNKLRS